MLEARVEKTKTIKLIDRECCGSKMRSVYKTLYSSNFESETYICDQCGANYGTWEKSVVPKGRAVIECKKCNSKDFEIKKVKYQSGDIHFVLTCNNCNGYSCLKKTDGLIELLKDEPLYKSKKLQQEEIKQTLF